MLFGALIVSSDMPFLSAVIIFDIPIISSYSSNLYRAAIGAIRGVPVIRSPLVSFILI